MARPKEDNRGGYRKPNNPAPVSGPGALSRRTDGGPGDPNVLRGGGKYGESRNLAEFQSGAPMQAPDAAGAVDPEAGKSPFVGLFDQDSQRPDEPVTAGASAGDGPGMEALGLLDVDDQDVQSILPDLPILEWLSNSPGAQPSTRAAIRAIKARL